MTRNAETNQSFSFFFVVLAARTKERNRRAIKGELNSCLGEPGERNRSDAIKLASNSILIERLLATRYNPTVDCDITDWPFAPLRRRTAVFYSDYGNVLPWTPLAQYDKSLVTVTDEGGWARDGRENGTVEGASSKGGRFIAAPSMAWNSTGPPHPNMPEAAHDSFISFSRTTRHRLRFCRATLNSSIRAWPIFPR